MESLHSSTRGSRKVAGLTMNKETDESIISSFDCRDTSEIELDTAESNLLDALKEYSDSAANVLRVLKDSLGSDCSSWNKNPKLTRLKPYLRDWYLETKWKPKIGHASILLKCREEEVVATMKTLLKKKSSKELKASDPELYNFSVNTRRIVLYFIENTIIKRAIALKECSPNADEDGNDAEVSLFMPSSSCSGFYAPNRLRLLPVSKLQTDISIEYTSLWLLTGTPDIKSVKKTLTLTETEFVYVYIPTESTQASGWELNAQVRVLVLKPGAKVGPGFDHTVQVVDPSSLLPVPAAPLFASVRLLGSRNGPGQLMAVQAIVASYDAKSKFKQFKYWLDQPHNKPPVELMNPNSKDYTAKSLERIDLNKVKLHDEENMILNLEVGTRLWLQVEGVLHGGLVIQRTTTLAMELSIVRAESEVREETLPDSSAGVEANSTGAAPTGAGPAASTNRGSEEALACPSAYVTSMDLSTLVLGDSLHVVNQDLFPLAPEIERELLLGLATIVVSETPEDTSPCEDWLRVRRQEQAYDYVVLERNYLNNLRIHLHLDEKNELRLLRCNLIAPIASFLETEAKKKEVPVKASTYWLEAWASGTVIPSPLPDDNAELHIDVNLSSFREYFWGNFDGIFLLDVTKISNDAAYSKTKALFHPGVQFVRCIFDSGTFNGRHLVFTVTVKDTWTLKNPENCLLSSMPQSAFCSAIFLGDRLVELGSDNGCVVISIARRPCRDLPLDPPGWIWTCTVAWDDKQRLNQDVPVTQIEDRFMLLSHASAEHWDSMCPPIAQKPTLVKKRTRTSKKKVFNIQEKKQENKTSVSRSQSIKSITDPLAKSMQKLCMQSDTGKKTNAAVMTVKKDALALMQTIKTRFEITDDVWKQMLATCVTEKQSTAALLTEQPSTGATKGRQEQFDAIPNCRWKFFTLLGVIDKSFLSQWANHVGFNDHEYILMYHLQLKKSKQPWPKFTQTLLADFLFSVVGHDRPQIGWLHVVEEDFNLQEYGIEKLRNLIFETKQIMPAEFQVHINHYMQDPSLRSKFMSILLRVAITGECPVKFTLLRNAVFNRSALKYRNFGERSVTPQIRAFRALCEYLIFGQNTSFFCSLYNITTNQLQVVLEWLESNLTMKETVLFGWFFKPTRLKSSITRTLDSDVIPNNTLPPFWEYDKEDSQFLQPLLQMWETFELKDEGNVFSAHENPLIRNWIFKLALCSVHIVEEAAKLTPDLKEIHELNMHLQDFKHFAGDAIGALVDERSVVLSSYHKSHRLADDCLLIAMHWPDIVGAETWVGEKKLASDLCERLITDKPKEIIEPNKFFCDIDNAPFRLKLMQFLLETTDVKIAASLLFYRYKCTEIELVTVMNLVKSFFVSFQSELDPDHFNIHRAVSTEMGFTFADLNGEKGDVFPDEEDDDGHGKVDEGNDNVDREEDDDVFAKEVEEEDEEDEEEEDNEVSNQMENEKVAVKGKSEAKAYEDEQEDQIREGEKTLVSGISAGVIEVDRNEVIASDVEARSDLNSNKRPEVPLDCASTPSKKSKGKDANTAVNDGNQRSSKRIKDTASFQIGPDTGKRPTRQRLMGGPPSLA